MRAVYIASAGRNRVKVGVSTNPARRVRSLSGASGYRLRLAEARDTDDAEAVERLAHWLLRATRLHGEWFRVNVETAKAAVERAMAMVAAGEGIPPEPVEARGADPRQFIGENLNLLMPEGTKERIAAVLLPGEKRLAFIREAIDREIKRRERKPKARQ